MGCNCTRDSSTNENELYRSSDDVKYPKTMVVKVQAMVRGFLARRRVMRDQSFTMTSGLSSFTQSIQMDTEQLEESRANVIRIHNNLREFEWGLYQDEDNYQNVTLEYREKLIFRDGSQYTGQWEIATVRDQQ